MSNNKIPKDLLPTLVIGLGGTGFQVIKRLKKLFAKKYNNINLPIRYLIIDTDLKSFLDESVANNEKCQLRFNEGVKSTLDWAYKNPNFNWLPKNPPLIPDFFTATDQGAGLMRPIGRLYLCKNAKLVYDTINAAKNDLVDLYKILTDVGANFLDNIGKHKVYIVGSLAGGTGCGTFLDVSVMLSKIFNRDNTNLIGMFTLESCYDDKLSADLDAQNRSKANCYAALKELEFYMSSIKNPEDERYKFTYTNIGEIKLEKKLLDICYLIENKNEAGGVLTNVEDIYDLCSLQLFQEIGTQLGSQLRADYNNFICKDKDPILNRERNFSTFSSSSMEIPIDNIKKYCCNKLAEQILSSLDKRTECDYTEKVDLLVDEIKNELVINTYLVNNKNNKLANTTTVDDLLKAKGTVVKSEQKVKENKGKWDEDYSNNEVKLRKIISEYININSTEDGLNTLSEILKETSGRFKYEFNNLTAVNPTKSSDIINAINNTQSQVSKRKIKEKDKKKIDECKNKINTFFTDNENEITKYIYKELSDLVEKIINVELDNIDIIRRKIYEFSREINRNLLRIKNKTNITYGGNIISREMVSEDFYEEYYNENYKEHLNGIIQSMLSDEYINVVFKEDKERPNNLTLLTLLKNDIKNLIRLCEYKIKNDKSLKNVTIINFLRKNAEKQNKTAYQYIKEELEITSTLAKPFWSAVKNPDVSWTECYYIGSIKDEDGISIKPHEEIDSWIRSQMGERSRQAKYVETTSSSSIDVIHITMGACAGYLPDVKIYKQFYLKLLTQKTYPLHLNESYVGLEELEIEAENLFNNYSKAQAYGVILKINNNYFYNLKEDGKSFIYKSPRCISIDNDSIENALDLPENITDIDENLILGKDSKEVIDKLNEDTNLSKIINDYITLVEKGYTKDKLIEHKSRYTDSYKILKNDGKKVIKENNEQGDFIVYEKLRYEKVFK